MNLGAYYLVGIPVALILGFALHLRGMGLWGGLVSGAAVQSILFSVITSLTNWEKQVNFLLLELLICILLCCSTWLIV